jgi:hypothetical protein
MGCDHHNGLSSIKARRGMQLLVGLLGGVIGSIAGGSLTWASTRWTLRRQLEHSYDKELRSERLAAYRQLWQITGALPRYQWPSKASRSDLRQLMKQFHRWYFDVGGLFFSQAAKDAYFEMMNALDATAGRRIDDDTEVDDVAFLGLFRAGELLRLQLAADVGTGLQPQVASLQLRPVKSPDEKDH